MSSGVQVEVGLRLGFSGGQLVKTMKLDERNTIGNILNAQVSCSKHVRCPAEWDLGTLNYATIPTIQELEAWPFSTMVENGGSWES